LAGVDDPVVPGAALEYVVDEHPTPAEEHVVAVAAAERVGPAAANQRVVAGPAAERVSAGAGPQGVVAVATIEDVRPAAADESVATPATGPLADVTDGEPDDTALTVMVNVWAAGVSIPPPAVPPLFLSTTVTVAASLAFGAGVKVRTPAALTAGCTEKRALLVLVTVKVRV
jgi:hypothetical protein